MIRTVWTLRVSESSALKEADDRSIDPSSLWPCFAETVCHPQQKPGPRPWLGFNVEKVDYVANSYPAAGESEVKSLLRHWPHIIEASVSQSNCLAQSHSGKRSRRPSQFGAPLGQR